MVLINLVVSESKAQELIIGLQTYLILPHYLFAKLFSTQRDLHMLAFPVGVEEFLGDVCFFLQEERDSDQVLVW